MPFESCPIHTNSPVGFFLEVLLDKLYILTEVEDVIIQNFGSSTTYGKGPGVIYAFNITFVLLKFILRPHFLRRFVEAIQHLAKHLQIFHNYNYIVCKSKV